MKNYLTVKGGLLAASLMTFAALALATPIPIDTSDVIAQINVAGTAVVAVGMAVLGIGAIAVAIKLIRRAM